MAKAKTKKKAVAKKTIGKAAVTSMYIDPSLTDIKQEFIPHRCYALNLALSNGQGLPRQQIIEIFGPEGSGKTTLGYEFMSIAASYQDALVFFFSQETKPEDARMLKFGLIKGVNYVERRARYIEDLFIQGNEILATHTKVKDPRPILIFLDSLNAVPPFAHVHAKDPTNMKVGAIASAWAAGLRVWASEAYYHDITIIITNHRTSKINTGGGGRSGPSYTTPGGAAVKHWATTRLAVTRIGKLDTPDGSTVGQISQFEAMKNKFSPPFNKIRLPIYYGNPTVTDDYVGTHDEIACLYLLEDKGFIQTTGGGYRTLSLVDAQGEVVEHRYRGLEQGVQLVREHKPLVYATMANAMFSQSFAAPGSTNA